MSDKIFVINLFDGSPQKRVFTVKSGQKAFFFADNGFVTIEVDGNFIAAYPSHKVSSIESLEVEEGHNFETGAGG